MKIALTGAPSVGKTTLIEKIDMPKIYEAARLIIKTEGNPLYMTQPQKNDFQRKVYNMQKFLESEEHYISDRSLYCCLAYTFYNAPDIYKELFEEMKEYLTKYPYDIVIYLPIEFKLQEDECRYEDETFRKKIDIKIKEILKELNVKYYILSGSLEKRERHLNNIIKFHSKTND